MPLIYDKLLRPFNLLSSRGSVTASCRLIYAYTSWHQIPIRVIGPRLKSLSIIDKRQEV